MSRSSRLAERLEQLKGFGVIEDFVRDSNDGDRIRWLIQLNRYEQHWFDTNQAEAFATGAIAGLVVNA